MRGRGMPALPSAAFAPGRVYLPRFSFSVTSSGGASVSQLLRMTLRTMQKTGMPMKVTLSNIVTIMEIANPSPSESRERGGAFMVPGLWDFYRVGSKEFAGRAIFQPL